MAISEESLTNMLSAMGREIGNAIATANNPAVHPMGECRDVNQS